TNRLADSATTETPRASVSRRTAGLQMVSRSNIRTQRPRIPTVGAHVTASPGESPSPGSGTARRWVSRADDGRCDEGAFGNTAENVVGIVGRQHELPLVLFVATLALATPPRGTHHRRAATTTGATGTPRGGRTTGEGTPRGTPPRTGRRATGTPRTRRRTTSTPGTTTTARAEPTTRTRTGTPSRTGTAGTTHRATHRHRTTGTTGPAGATTVRTARTEP